MKITRLLATPVRVPTRPNSIQSANIKEDDWSKSPDGKHVKGGTASVDLLTKYILRAWTDSGLEGVGESYRDVSLDNLRRNARMLAGARLEDVPLAHLPFPPDREYHALELLLYDLAGKALSVPVHRLLGGKVRERVECSYWSGRRTPEEAGEVAYQGKLKGFDCIKFKCNLDDDVVAWAREIQRRCGPDMRLTFDPNQRWGDYAGARKRMEALQDFNVIVIEDPLDRTRLEDYRKLRGIGRMAVVRHVALPYHAHGQRAEHALDALRADAVDGFNFNGPLAHFVRLANLAALAGKPCWHGSEVDLGILEAGYVHAAAASPACTWPSDIFCNLVREDDLIAEPLRFEGKWVRLPEGPGLGVQLDLDALEKYRCGPDETLLPAG